MTPVLAVITGGTISSTLVCNWLNGVMKASLSERLIMKDDMLAMLLSACITDNGIHLLQHTVDKRWASDAPQRIEVHQQPSRTLEASHSQRKIVGVIDGVPADAGANNRRCAARLRCENAESMAGIHSWFHDTAISA